MTNTTFSATATTQSTTGWQPAFKSALLAVSTEAEACLILYPTLDSTADRDEVGRYIDELQAIEVVLLDAADLLSLFVKEPAFHPTAE